MPDVKELIDGHNKAILQSAETAQPQQTRMAKGRKHATVGKKEVCPLDGECLVSEVVYQATVKAQDAQETHIGLYRNHQMSFRHVKRRNETELSKHLWKLKDESKEFTVTWKIIAEAKPYTNFTKRCNLCTTEKVFSDH